MAETNKYTAPGAKKYPSQIVSDEFAASLANRTSPLLSAREVKNPINGITGKPMTAINRLILDGRQSDPRWFTENQAKTLGYHLKPETEGKDVVFWEQYQRLKMVDPNTGQPVLDDNGQQKYSYKKHERPFMKLYTVYHASQLELENGQPIPGYQPLAPQIDPVGQLENIVKASGVNIVHDQKGRSFYRAKDETIHMPPVSDYKTPEGYYSDLIRELARWTRHESRLNRVCGPFGTEAYAKEELKVNLAALAIAQSLGMAYQPGQSSQYVKDWQVLVKKYPFLLSQSAKEAEAIKDFVLDFGLTQEAAEVRGQDHAAANDSKLDMKAVISESAQVLSNAYSNAQIFVAMEDIHAATNEIIAGPGFPVEDKDFDSKAVRYINFWSAEAADLDNISNDRLEELSHRIVVLGHLHALRTGNEELKETCQRAIGDYIAAFPEKGIKLDQVLGQSVPQDMVWGNDIFINVIYSKDESGQWRVANPLEIPTQAFDEAVPIAVINSDNIISMDGGSLLKNWRANQISSPGAELITRLADICAEAQTPEEMMAAAKTIHKTIDNIKKKDGLRDRFTRRESAFAAQMEDMAFLTVIHSGSINEKSLRQVHMNILSAANAWAGSVGSHEHQQRYESAINRHFDAPHSGQFSREELLGRSVNFDAVKELPNLSAYYSIVQNLQWCDYALALGRNRDWLCRENPDSPWRNPTDDETRTMKTLKEEMEKKGQKLDIPLAILPNVLVGGNLYTLDGQSGGIVKAADLREINGLNLPDHAISSTKNAIRESVYRILDGIDDMDLLRENFVSINALTSPDNIQSLAASFDDNLVVDEALAKKLFSVSQIVKSGNTELVNADLPHLQISVAVAGMAYGALINDMRLRDNCRDFIKAYGRTFDLSSEYKQIMSPVTEQSVAAALDDSSKVFGLDYLNQEMVCHENGQWREATMEEMEYLESRENTPDAIVPLAVLCINDKLSLTFDGQKLTPERLKAMLKSLEAGRGSQEAPVEEKSAVPPRKDPERPTPKINPLTPEQELALVCERAGLILDGPPIMDGKKHRVPVIGGKKGALDGEYCAHADGRPNGWVKNYRTDEYQKWLYTGHELSPEQKAELRQTIEAEKKRKREETKERKKAAHEKVKERWGYGARVVKEDHPYLAAKGVKPFGVAQDQYGNLLVPAFDITKTPKHDPLDNPVGLQTLQTISPDGQTKMLAKDCPLKGGMLMIDSQNILTSGSTAWIIDGNGMNPEGGYKDVLVAEGYATAATLHMATGQPVAVSFTAANLESVARNIKKVFPDTAIAICADNDHQRNKNVGIEKAEAAAKAVGGKVIIPEFTEAEKAQGLTDFNDLAKSRCLEAVTRIIAKELGREKTATQSQNAGLSR